MPEQEFSLVQSSYQKVRPTASTVGELFYTKLFELDPSLRPLFKGDIKQQGDKLMQMISIAVDGLDNIEDLLPAVKALGERHYAYGVLPKHYESVGVALMWTLEKGLGELFTEDVREAWEATYEVLSGVMIEAAHKKSMTEPA